MLPNTVFYQWSLQSPRSAKCMSSFGCIIWIFLYTAIYRSACKTLAKLLQNLVFLPGVPAKSKVCQLSAQIYVFYWNFSIYCYLPVAPARLQQEMLPYVVFHLSPLQSSRSVNCTHRYICSFEITQYTEIYQTCPKRHRHLQIGPDTAEYAQKLTHTSRYPQICLNNLRYPQKPPDISR